MKTTNMRVYPFPPIRILLSAAALVASSLGAHIISADPSGSFPVRRVVIRGDGTPGPYRVGFRFVDGTAALDSSAFNPRGLAVSAWDDTSETLTFSHPIPAGDSVAVTLAAPPDWLERTYRRRSGASAPGVSATTVDYRSARDRTPKAFPGLTFGGSKTFDVNVGGGREAALTQSLQLTISGPLSDDITLNAVVSDRNVPITPEGNTRELEELDRVLIELRGNRFTADMGDTDLRREGGRWLSWSRRLSGASVGLNARGISLFGSGAVSEGRYMSTTLSPVEGNQGPYRLIAADGNRDISIIPGTEKIWINGDRLTRGDADDYTIDYETGEVTFTGNRIIGSDKRNVADYEYTSESYRRTFYSAGGDGVFLGGRLTVGAVAAREADDTSRPVLVELDDASRHALSQAGDSLAVMSGIRNAPDDSTGSYDMVDGRLAYNPRGKGAYNVTFSWVGADRGSYRYTGGGVYEFVPPERRGPGSGASYEPRAAIPAPALHEIAGVRLAVEPIPSLRIETEVAGSSFDRNTLSSRNDRDNGGGAYRLDARLDPVIRTGAPVRVEFAGSVRSQGRTFLPLDRDRTAEENRRWGLPLVIPPGREQVSDYSGGLTLAEGRFAGTGVGFNGGRAEFGGTSSSSRTGATGAFMVKNRMDGRVDIHRIDRAGVPGLPDEDIGRITGNLGLRIAGFSPGVSWEREVAESSGTRTQGAGYDDVRVRLKSPDNRGVAGEAEWFYRRERAKRTSWEDSSLARGGSAGFTLGSGGRGLLKALYARRERTAGSMRNSADQAQLDVSWHPDDSRVRFDCSYRAGRMRDASKRKNYLYIGEGRGSYRWEDENRDGIRDPEEFIPDEHGAYHLYEERLDDYRPVNTVHAYSLFGADLFGKGSAEGSIKSETTFEINEKSSSPASDVFLLRLGAFRKRGLTMSGDARIQQDLTVPVSRGGSLRLRLFRLDSYTAEYVSGAERRGEQEQSLRLRLPVAGSSDAELTIARSLWSRLMEERKTGDFRVTSYSGEAGVSLYHEASSTATLSAGAGYDRDRESGVRARYFRVEPGYTYRISGKGRIETSYTFTSVGLSNAASGARLPYPMAKGCKEGVNHDVRAAYDHRLSQRMNMVASYTGRKFADRGFEHFAQVQMRALF